MVEMVKQPWLMYFVTGMGMPIVMSSAKTGPSWITMPLAAALEFVELRPSILMHGAFIVFNLPTLLKLYSPRLEHSLPGVLENTGLLTVLPPPQPCAHFDSEITDFALLS